MSSKVKFFIFLILLFIVLSSAGYIAYHFFIIKKDGTAGEASMSDDIVVYEKPDHHITGEIVEIKSQSITVKNRSSGEDERYDFLEDTECLVIDTENDSEETCDSNSLSEDRNQYKGIGVKLVVYIGTTDLKKIDIFISET